MGLLARVKESAGEEDLEAQIHALYDVSASLCVDGCGDS